MTEYHVDYSASNFATLIISLLVSLFVYYSYLSYHGVL